MTHNELSVARGVPKWGEGWQHYKGGRYDILGIVRMEAEGTEGRLYVAYIEAKCEPGVLAIGWLRPLTEFMGTVELGHASGLPIYVNRFVKVRNAL